MSQKLIQPINKIRVTASCKTDAYKDRFGLVHYGTDCMSSAGGTTVYASGNGTVLGAGYDSVFGNVVVVKYPAAYNHATGKYADLIVRYFHFASVAVKKGESVTRNTALGQYGATGQYVSGAHLHFEVDTDTAWPFFTPSLKGQSTFFKGTNFNANDKTMTNPWNWIHCKTSAPDSQTYTTDANDYIRAEDKTITKIQ